MWNVNQNIVKFQNNIEQASLSTAAPEFVSCSKAYEMLHETQGAAIAFFDKYVLAVFSGTGSKGTWRTLKRFKNVKK